LNLVVDRARLGDPRTGWDGFFAEHLGRVPELKERMAGARRVAQVRGVGPLAWRTSAKAVDGAALVGDACGYVDPITGEGIWFALRGAELLARDLGAAVAERSGSRRAVRRYLRARRLEIAPRLLLAKLLQRGLRHQGLAKRALALLERRPGLSDLLVSVTGDYVPLRELLRPGVWWRASLASPP
jgi:flavin-dependent dehydrogenase